jgi:hypothetical protein
VDPGLRALTQKWRAAGAVTPAVIAYGFRMSEIVITLVNQCDDARDAQMFVYQSRAPGDAGKVGSTSATSATSRDGQPAFTEIELPAGETRTLTVPAGPRYFVGVEDTGPGGLHPGRRDTLEVGPGSQTVVVRGSLVSGLRIAVDPG